MKLRRHAPRRRPLRGRFGARDIAGISADSRAVKPGFLFVAVPGTKADGLDFVPQALAAGAVAVMAERALGARLPDGVAYVEVANVRRALALAAAKFFPRQPATIAAVTGTSGKTSVAAFTRQIWSALGHRSREHRHRRRRVATRRGLRLADDTRSGRTAPHARSARRRWRHAILRWKRRRMGSISTGSTACGLRPADSPI